MEPRSARNERSHRRIVVARESTENDGKVEAHDVNIPWCIPHGRRTRASSQMMSSCPYYLDNVYLED